MLRPSRAIGLLILALVLGGCGGGILIVGVPPRERPARPAMTVDTAWRQASDVPHVSVFYDALAPYGVWAEDAALGWVWTPSDPEFAPYARGRWVETEAGPTFLADEAYGWAVAHYGRWFWQNTRWYWVPGTRWGPAWVAWRLGDDHRKGGGGEDSIVGWRALPPAGWTRPMPDEAWFFVPARDFLGPSVTGRTYGLRDVPWLVASSRPHDDDGVGDGLVVGPEVRFAGWRARKIALGRLPPGQVRWVPRWERTELRPRRSVRAGPAAPERRARKALVGTP